MSIRVLIGVSALFLILIATLGMADLKEGIVVYLPFDEGAGDVAKDISGNGHDGKIVNAKWTEGRFGKALEFNGKDTYVEIEFSDDFNIQGAITLAAWIKPGASSVEGYHGIINARKSTFGPYLLQTSRGFVEVVFDYGGPWTWLRSATSLKKGALVSMYGEQAQLVGANKAWHHIAATYDSKTGDIKIYINGKLDIGQGTQKTKGKIAPTPKEGVVIGHNYGQAGRFFEGAIDDVVIYNRALTDKEIRELFSRR